MRSRRRSVSVSLTGDVRPDRLDFHLPVSGYTLKRKPQDEPAGRLVQRQGRARISLSRLARTGNGALSSRMFFSWQYYFDRELVEREHPEIVIQEMVERTLMNDPSWLEK